MKGPHDHAADAPTLSTDHNPLLRPWQPPQPNNVAGKGQVERPGQSANLVWQNRPSAPTPCENALGDALERAFDGGATALDQVVDALNAQPFRQPDGRPWTPASFSAEMARLGA